MGSTFNQSSFLAAWRQYFPRAHIAEVYGPYPYQNLMDRSDCESTTPPALVGQTTNALTNCTFARDGGQKRSGSYSYLFTKTAGAGNAATAYLGASTGMNGLKPSAYTFNAWVYVPASGFTSGQVFISVGYIAYDGTTVVEQKGYWTGTTATWVQLTAYIVVPTNATAIFAYVGAVSASGANTFYVDDITFYDVFNTTMLANGTLSIYDGRQPQSADFPLYAGTNLCAAFTFPPDSFSLVGPTGIDTLEPLATQVALLSSTATWARCTNAAGAPLFDCSVGLASDGADLVLNINPFVQGEALMVSNGEPVRFKSIPTIDSYGVSG